MPEVDANTSILIAMSYQAMQKIEDPRPEISIPNSVSTILFMGFFIESNLNYLLKEIEGKEERYGGLIPKLNKFHSLTSRSAADKKLSADELDNFYPGIKRMKEFRNSIAHGTVLSFTEYIRDVDGMRQQAKDIADNLFNRAKAIGHDILRETKYVDAIKDYAQQIVWPT